MQVAKRDLNARYTDLSVMGVRVGVANFFLNQSIGIDETNTFQLNLFILHENCGRHRFSRFVGGIVGVANFFLVQSIGIDENNTFQLKFFI